MDEVVDWTPSSEEVARLAERLRQGTLSDITVLPSQRRDGDDFYSESDSQALKVPQGASTHVDFLDGEDQRRFLAEYSADVAMQLALGWLTDLSGAGLLGLVRYVVQRIRAAQGAGTLAEGAVLEINVAKLIKSGQDLEIEGLQIKARDVDVARAMVSALASRESAENLLEELTD